MKITSGFLIRALGVYSVLVVGLIASVILTSADADVHERAIIKMALGLIFVWIVVVGTLMVRYRAPITTRVRNMPLNWRVKFVLFATGLALLEEAVTVTMTNMAPLLRYLYHVVDPVFFVESPFQ